MPVTIDPPSTPSILEVQRLNQQQFAQFGTVISNPSPSLTPNANISSLPGGAVLANQGSAIKYLDVTDMLDLYDTAPSAVTSRAVMNMFVCAPRELKHQQHQPGGGKRADALFPIEVLERHPFTTQTFIPLGLSPAEQADARYLVIVAGSLPPSPTDESLPVPSSSSRAPSLPGRGLPDLSHIHAFIATGAQAVTYGAGTWHAPMVALGKRPIDFVVVQFANGVGIEDCQETMIGTAGSTTIHVSVPPVPLVSDTGSPSRAAKL